MHGPHVSRTRTLVATFAALLAAVLLGACSSSTPTERTITLTFIRHAESEANADGVIDTSVPGPALTSTGQKQAAALAERLKGNGYDGVYASKMVRTQQTAAPMAKELGKQVTVLPGLDEISAGWFNGDSVESAARTFMVAPADWLRGDTSFSIPGSVSGNEFNSEFTAAVQRIYDSGNSKPVAFSSAASIMMWTLMNARNGKDSLATDHPLPNTGRVVLTGSPVTGWTLVDWDGITQF
ncbi:histidine phosphatase family protein [Mycobacterium sp. CVI_P3]|uniref:Histidine phosphatase family protein n=1 Tax=Mycobacterium pinniadriaticum TaxID=2994102 RepID=A0ABT3SH95_9MYCO|nr:histidine phosphatase family protein [Mycobacterium pinniadriaticum]MCX2932495.1 histidine phosphatase family protein [Mycobacterium pinniadriaticum]MCX2938871.1 histidine phosphatase family protein [Mycobacterium pinniadriaticum]